MRDNELSWEVRMADKHALIIALSLFDMVWSEMEYFGYCDSLRATEYRRVVKEWKEASCPFPIAPFIHTHANMIPENIEGVRHPPSGKA